MIFYANLFGVGIVNDAAYEEINSNEIYKYSYIYAGTEKKNINKSQADTNEVSFKKYQIKTIKCCKNNRKRLFLD